MKVPKEYIPINIIQSDKDLSLFKIQNAKIVLKDVKNAMIVSKNFLNYS